MKLAGRHNAMNALAALALCEAVGPAADRCVAALRDFAGLPHRVETVLDIGGVRFIDDSKGTNVGATVAAIEGLGRPLCIILGGDGKGQDFTPLGPVCRAPRALLRADRSRRTCHRSDTAGRTPWPHAQLRDTRRGNARRVRCGAARRRSAAVARLRQPGHVPQLRASRRGVHRRSAPHCEHAGGHPMSGSMRLDSPRGLGQAPRSGRT
jgi:hypothetical protein